jgi:hypothetical protein
MKPIGEIIIGERKLQAAVLVVSMAGKSMRLQFGIQSARKVGSRPGGYRGKAPETWHTRFSKRKEVQAAAKQFWRALARANGPDALSLRSPLHSRCLRPSFLYPRIRAFAKFLLSIKSSVSKLFSPTTSAAAVERGDRSFLSTLVSLASTLTALQLRYASAPLVFYLQSRRV